MGGVTRLRKGRDREGDAARIAALRPIDDEFMRAVYRDRLDLAQDALRTVTGVAGLELVRGETQRDLKIPGGARSVVLDFYGVDAEGNRYDLEVERSDASPRRARYHASAMDVGALGAGRGFEDLPEAYVIFVAESDPFGLGLGVYRFERACGGLELGDGAHILYANAEYDGDDELGRLMHDFLCSDPDDMLTEGLAERVRHLKADPEGVRQVSEIFDDLREECREEGREEERAGFLASAARMVRDGALSVQQAASGLGFDESEVDEAVRKLAAVG